MEETPFNPGYYTTDDLRKFAFRRVGNGVLIARNCTIVGVENIEIGDNVRIDGGTVLVAVEGYLTLGSYIHIGGNSFLACGGGITMDDFSGLSQGVRIYSTSDDYSGQHLTNPTVPKKYLGVTSAPVRIGRHVIIGSGSVVMPGVSIADGSALGAMSLATKSLDEWGIYFGVPARRLRARSRDLLKLELALQEEMNGK